jgi:hypothetical protein
MTSSLLIAASALVALVLGSIHLLYTFRGPKLWPRDPAVRAAMEGGTPVITRETTVWKCWVGFNASHSFGIMLFGLVYGYLALVHPEFLFGFWFLQGLGAVFLVTFCVLAKAYWFSIPFRGVLVATGLYLSGVAIYHL